MGQAAGYLLQPSPKRAGLLLEALTNGFYERPRASEPVPEFKHSKNSALIVFLCLEKDLITHIADGRRTLPAGTKLSKLNIENSFQLETPLKLSAVREALPKRLQSYFAKSIESSSYLPRKTFEAVVEIVAQQAPDIRGRLARFSRERSKQIASLTNKQRQELAFQKEALTLSLRIAGLETQELLEWRPSDNAPRSFLDGLSSVEVREDAMIISDLDTIPGFLLDKTTHAATRSFVDRKTGTVRLTVVMANRLPLEKQTGSDLIYCNDTFKSFVFVQYKSMRKEGSNNIFRWQDNPEDDLVKETSRMKTLLTVINQLKDDDSLTSFRLHNNPFLLKFCPKVDFNPDDTGLFPGMYIPLEYWERFTSDQASTGDRGGKFLSFDNIGRKLTNSEFIILVAGSWIGTTVPQFESLQTLIKNVLQEGRTLTFAIERHDPLGDVSATTHAYVDDEETEENPNVVYEEK